MIEVNSVTKRYGRKKVLDGLSFTAQKGEITCLIGINGTGKTTTLKAISGLTPVNSGKILIDGQPYGKHIYEKITFIPDAPIMLPRMRIKEAMSFMEDFYQNWNGQRAADLLHFFKLNENDRIGELSKGNTAKTNLMLGLALDVDYVLMDEPFSGIDIFSREQITEVFTSNLVEDRGVLITTHEINDIEHLLDKVVLLGDGKALKEFYTEDIRISEGKSVVDMMREVYRP
ncbi:ABC transporter ATP-binding protein [Heyndrickxia acidiproducens]|uniref:ABC transporter ATP-binding protein n=1 Tax=Heyndrickxia acidiproducens TaxID=1121084 RepID=UPI000382D5C3|nr:ABC transporter ATP-binding protein [Heyndrickxia acidiproducens]